ncbi:MAG: KH domain-containing protein [Candidatus Nanohaloarchaea archaeon]|nr:KH domain-containing protein [Candidatus Nanohaloarchaea archaeon]
MRVVRIPDERVGVLIGEGGETVDEIQDLTDAEITIEDNEVTVDCDDPLDEIRALNIVKAIGRGFSPERALRLLEENSTLVVIDVTHFESTDNGKERLKGRVIGRNGEAKEHILGPVRKVEVAKKAVEMLLDGRSHATAYQYLEQNKAQTL